MQCVCTVLVIFFFTFYVLQTQLSQLSIQSHWQQHWRPTSIYLYGKRDKKDFLFKKVVHSEPTMPTKRKIRCTYFVSILFVTSAITRAHWVSGLNVSISVCFLPLLYLFCFHTLRWTDSIPMSFVAQSPLTMCISSKQYRFLISYIFFIVFHSLLCHYHYIYKQYTHSSALTIPPILPSVQ